MYYIYHFFFLIFYFSIHVLCAHFIHFSNTSAAPTVRYISGFLCRTSFYCGCLQCECPLLSSQRTRKSQIRAKKVEKNAKSGMQKNEERLAAASSAENPTMKNLSADRELKNYLRGEKAGCILLFVQMFLRGSSRDFMGMRCVWDRSVFGGFGFRLRFGSGGFEVG